MVRVVTILRMELKLTKTVVECHAINTTAPHHHHIPLHHHRPSPSSPSPLSRSCVCGNLDAVAVLLDAGAELRMSTKKAGRTALHMAAAAGSPSVRKWVTPPPARCLILIILLIFKHFSKLTARFSLFSREQSNPCATSSQSKTSCCRRHHHHHHNRHHHHRQGGAVLARPSVRSGGR